MVEIIDIAEQVKIEGRYVFDPEVLDRVSPEIKELIDANFPVSFYGEDIYIYEAWSMRSILYSAAQLAVEDKLKQLKDKQ